MWLMSFNPHPPSSPVYREVRHEASPPSVLSFVLLFFFNVKGSVVDVLKTVLKNYILVVKFENNFNYVLKALEMPRDSLLKGYDS